MAMTHLAKSHFSMGLELRKCKDQRGTGKETPLTPFDPFPSALPPKIWNETTTVTPIRTYYDVLKVARDAPTEVIEAAGLVLTEKRNAERGGAGDTSDGVLELIVATAVLKDPTKRAARIDQDNYDDDLEPKSYHDMVSSKLIDLQLPLARACETMDKAEDVQHKLDKLSKDIVALIQKKPSAAPLTNIAKHFAPKNPVGCSGVDSVQLHKGLEPCGVGRVHVKNKQCATQKPENIVFRTETPYKLQPGR